MKSALSLITKNLINASLVFLVILILFGSGMMVYNKNIIANNLELLKETDIVKREIRYGYDIVTRHVDVSMRGFAIIREERFNYISTEQIRAQMEKNFTRVDSMLKAQNFHDPVGQKVIDDYKDTLRTFVEYHAMMTDLLRKDDMSTFREIFLQDRGAKIPTAPVIKVVDAFEDKLNQQANDRYKAAVKTNLVIQLMLVIVGIPIIIFIYRKLESEKSKSLRLVHELADYNRKYMFDSGADRSMEEQSVLKETIVNIQKASEFVNQIAHNNFEVVWQDMNENNADKNKGTLAGALISMKDEMLKVKQEDSRRNWTNEGLSTLGEILRKEAGTDKWTEAILISLVKYINANQGGLFVVNDDNPASIYLELKSAYAYERKKFLQKKIQPGEGITGQTWQEGETTYLKEIPQGYLQITSGLGGAQPNNLLVVPLKYDGKTEGIIEIASFHIFEPHVILFVEKICESIALTISSSAIAKRTKMLLNESTQMTGRLQAQEEEMRQNMEELSATQEEMGRKEQEYLSKIAKLEQQVREATVSGLVKSEV